MSGKTVVLLLSLSAFAGVAVAQEPQMNTEVLVTLHEAGVSATELIRLVDQHGIPVDLDASSVQRLRKGGLDQGLVTRLENELKLRQPDPMNIADVMALVEMGVNGEDVIARIRKTDSRFDLTIDDLVGLARRGVPAEVIKEMRARGKTTTEVAQAATTVSTGGVVDMTRANIPANEIIRRIRKADARFDVAVDDLLDMTRQGVHQDVLKEIWARKGDGPTVLRPTVEHAEPGPEAPSDNTPARTTKAPELITHREPAGAFSINVPSGFSIYREDRNANSLVSFTRQAQSAGDQTTETEIQILRYRSRRPEWLVEKNLDAIAQRFLTTLKSSYVKRGLSLTYSDGTDTHVSGRPARSYRVGSSAQSGASNQGRMLVTWQQDQVYVLSYATRADLLDTTGALMEQCISSFTFESPRQDATDSGEDVLAGLFNTWREAVTKRDFALYRTLCAPGYDTTANRASFVSLSDRLSDPRFRLTLGTVERGADSATVECKVIGPTTTESITLEFQRDGDHFRLR